MMHELICPVLELVQAAGQATLPYWQVNVAVFFLSVIYTNELKLLL